jgi:hypothetical protein
MKKLYFFGLILISLGYIFGLSLFSSDNKLRLDIPLLDMKGRVGKCVVEILDPDDNIIGSSYRYIYVSRDYYSFPMGIELDKDIEDYDGLRAKVSFKKQISVYSLYQLQDRMVTKVLGQNEFIKGTDINYRIIVCNQRTNEPLQNARVVITLKAGDDEKEVFKGMTDRSGTCRTDFTLPDDLDNATLIFDISSDIGKDRYETGIKLLNGHLTYLVTDKPIYQPGQTIHIRTLSLVKPALSALPGRNIIFEVEDSKGNKVYKKGVKTDRFGTAYTDFRLADELNFGDYTIRAILDNEKTEKTVKVEKYVLPKFKVTLTTDKDYYLPGEQMDGDIDVEYFFGKPVKNSTVKITTFRYDIGFQKEGVIDGKTDENGKYHFSYKLPDYFIGEPLEKGDAFLRIDIEVIDKANHSEKISMKKKVVKDVINISLVPEGGALKPRLDNRIYVLASYPDGSPVIGQVNMKIGGKKMSAQTDDYGIAEFSFQPDQAVNTFFVEVKDDRGETASIEKQFSSDLDRDQIIMRMERGIYKVGDNIDLDFFTTKKTGRVYFDIIKDNQTVLTRSVDIKNGRGSYKMNITPDMTGSIWLHAYIVTLSSDIVRDTRFCFIHGADDLDIDVSSGKKEYLPGEDGTITFRVTGTDGRPRVAALCIAIVDEAVFAVSELQPGLEKVYFRLEKEILKPRYEIHGFEPAAIVKKTEIQARAENIMFSTLTPKEPFPVNYTTPRQANDKIKSVFYNRLSETRNMIYSAINKYYTKHNEYPRSEGGIQLLVDENFIDEEDLLDPWYRRYHITTNDTYLSWFNIVSAGPDGVIGNEDDIDEWSMGWGAVDEGGIMLRAEQQAMMPMAAPKGAVAAREVTTVSKTGDIKKGLGVGTGEEPRVREYFPETFIFEPALITDANGVANLNLTMPDAITTWRITASASSQNGDLGSVLSQLKVFQEFFVDIDLPVALTQGDEISIPIALYNYLPRDQEIKVVLQEEKWFDILGKSEIIKKLKKDEVSVVYFPIKVHEIGYFSLLVRAYGEVKSDAIKRNIAILPDGKRFESVISDRLEGKVVKNISFPDNAISDANSIVLKIFPGIYSQIVEGLENLFRMPFGCFEQTTSVTYPNILLLDYMRQTGQIKPDIEMAAEEYISIGYQRLLSFEVQGGGFSWFGNAPANRVLTAYGLMEFNDMAKVYEIDEKLIERTIKWLKNQQNKDGSWTPDEQYCHAESWTKIQKNEILPTAYIVWALGETGERGPVVTKGLAFLKKNLDITKDPYITALIANAFVAVEPKGATTMEVLKKLVNMAKKDNDALYWSSDLPTVTFSRGKGADIEATGLATYALIKSGKYSDIVTKALTYIIRSKGSGGLWHTTQGTVIALRSLVAALGGSAQDIDATLIVRMNDKKIKELKINNDNADLMHQVDLNDHIAAHNVLEIDIAGEGNFMYEITNAYYIPWTDLPKPLKPPFIIDVKYDRTNLSINDLVNIDVDIRLNQSGTAQMVMVDLGIPPGFEVQTPTLDELVGKVIQKYSITPRQLIIYLDEVASNKPVKFSYSIKAKYPIKAQIRSSRVYEYYNDTEEAIEHPIEMKVTL